MRKFVLITLLPVVFWACDGIPSEVEKLPVTGYNVAYVAAPDQFIYSSSNTTLTISVKIDNSENVDRVQYQIVSDDGDVTLQPLKDMKKNDDVYNASVAMSQDFSSGYYLITIYIDDALNQNKITAVKKFKYDNSTVNYPPVLSNLSMPDTVSYEAKFDFSIKASDQNGFRDVARVYYRLYKPDGTLQQNSQGITEFDMFDDGSSLNINGDTSHDKTANDGTYTYWLAFPNNAPIGTWRFEIEAIDRGDSVSTTVIKNVELK